MIKKVCSIFLEEKIKFLRYLVVGFSGLFLDIGTLYILSRTFGINPTLAVCINQVILIGYNFTLNKYWTFGGGGMPHKQFVRYLVLVTFNYIFSGIVMYGFNEIGGYDEILVRIGAIAIMTLWNFILYKNWVYKS